jgi:DNA-binding CsgD family transcriptional regulator
LSVTRIGKEGRVKDYRQVPWLKVHDYLLQIGSCRTIPQLTHIACREMGSLIPSEVAGFHSAVDARILDAVGIDSSLIASYNSYWRTVMPGSLAEDGKDWDFTFLKDTTIIDWRKRRDLEYATDFMLRNRMCKSLAHVLPGYHVTITAQRSRLSPDYTDTEVTILDLLNQHLNTYWSLLNDREGARPGPMTGEIAERFPFLTSREAEICALLARRLQTAEIAACLFISHRTVERHIQDSFEKLNVHSRDHLRRKLGIQEAARPLPAFPRED